MQENVILEHLQRIEKQLEIINSKLDNFMGFEELSEEELKELDEIEAEMEKGEKFPLEWNEVRNLSQPAGKEVP